MSSLFVAYQPGPDDFWRAIILFGRNVASFKFALGKALLDLKPEAGRLIKLEELALPFATHLREHLKGADKQGTSPRSKFLDACRKANMGELTDDELVDATVRLGFNNVIDAFHVVSRRPVPKPFFVDERGANGGIRITDSFSNLLEGRQAKNLGGEAEARWRLVETAWELGLSRSLLSIAYDDSTQALFALDAARRRKPVTSSRPALNGYQKGRCFYCFRHIALDGPAGSDVDHFFPHTLKMLGLGSAIDGIWNLVLTCRECNRGVGGKFDLVPGVKLLARLSRRNEYLIESHHPLRETLMMQTGVTSAERRRMLNGMHVRAKAALIHEWVPVEVEPPVF